MQRSHGVDGPLGHIQATHKEGLPSPNWQGSVPETHPTSPDRGGADSDGYSTVSEAPNGRHHRRRRWNEKCLAPACLDMPIFKSTDQNAE